MLWLFEFMRITLNCVIFVSLCKTILSYASQINISSTTTSTVSNFYQDFSSCSCDKSPSLCDNYCCCDTACPSVTKHLLRLQWVHGRMHTAALLHLRLFNTSAIKHLALAMGHSMICRASTSQTVDLSAISIKICKLPPSRIPLSANCKQKYTQLISYTKCSQPIVSKCN